MFKKKSTAGKLWLKLTDKRGYKEYKWEASNYQNTAFQNFLTGTDRLNSLEKIKAVSNITHQLNLLHSGNAGDIIYSLATVKRIQELTGASINLYFRLGRPINLPKYNTHPLGNVMMNQKMADLLSQLISAQPYINECKSHQDEEIHIDLDYFRSGTIPTQGNIARWYGYTTGVNPELFKSWLNVEPDDTYSDTIVLARSGRYQNTSLDFSFLKQYPKVIFLGIKSEYEAICEFLPGVKWVEVKDFLQMAQIIAGCKLFIGNQSFPFAIAEGLKVPRVLELSLEIINVVPEGPNAYDFLLQEHFESLVAGLYS